MYQAVSQLFSFIFAQAHPFGCTTRRYKTRLKHKVMKKQVKQNYLITLNYTEYGPFVFFITQGWCLIELHDKWKSGIDTINVSLLLPLEFDVSRILPMWQKWKSENLDKEYSVQN
jgi:hypothetical protein